MRGPQIGGYQVAVWATCHVSAENLPPRVHLELGHGGGDSPDGKRIQVQDQGGSPNQRKIGQNGVVKEDQPGHLQGFKTEARAASRSALASDTSAGATRSGTSSR